MPKVVPKYKDEAKGRILDAAAQVFAEKGFSRATMDDIAKKIGVSKGALYLYFKSKEQLFEELCRTATRNLEENLDSAFMGADVEKGADAYFDRDIGLSTANVTLWLQTLAEARSNRVVQKMQEETSARIIDVLANFVEELKKRGLVRRELDSISVAKVFSAFHDGVLVSMLQGATVSTAKETWREGLRSFINGMGEGTHLDAPVSSK